MTVDGTNNRTDYDPDGLTPTFIYDFRVDNASDMVVYADGEVYSEPFTITGLTNPLGGDVIFDVAPVSGIEVLSLIREVPLTQQTAYPPLGPFPAPSHEAALDKLTFADQQLQEQIGRAGVAPVDADPETDYTLPKYAPGEFWYWDVFNKAIRTETIPGSLSSDKLRVIPTRVDLLNQMGAFQNEPVVLLGYSEIGDGGGGPIRYWDEGQTPGFYTDDLGRIAVPTGGDGSAAWITGSKDPVSLLEYGSVPDTPAVNDTTAINNANLYAEANGLVFILPPGEFHGFEILPKVPWIGTQGKSILKSTNDTTVAYNFCKVEGVHNWTGKDVTFDGDVSDDPLVWNSGTFNDFSGSIGLYLLNSDRFSLEGCAFRNTRSASLRIESCDVGSVNKVSINKARAQFGDGIYMNSCSKVDITSCDIEDVQRIGVVAENGCTVCNISDTKVTLAAHQGIDYGGTEVNSGFWVENSTEVNVDRCVAINTNTNGFFFSTGTATPLMNASSLRATDCTAIDVVTPFTAESGGGTPLKAVFLNCRGFGTTTGIAFDAGNETDNYAAIGCHVQIDLSKSPSIARAYSFLSRDAHNVAPKFSFIDCTTDYLNYTTTDFEDAAKNTADIGPFPTTGNLNALADVTIRNVTSIRADRRTFIKARSGKLKYNISDGNYDIRAVNAIVGEGYIRNCTLSYIEITTGPDVDSNMSLTDCKCTGRATINTHGHITLHNSEIDMDSSRMAFGIDENTKFPSIDIRDCIFKKDVTNDGFVLQINYTAANMPLTTFANNTFVNKSATPPAADVTFIRFVKSTNSFVFSNTIMDANVNDLYVQNVTTGTPGDTTDVVFH